MIFLTLGIVIAVLGASAGLLLPRAPSFIQTNTVLQPIGSFLINKQSQVVLVGVGLIVVAVFFSGRRA